MVGIRVGSKPASNGYENGYEYVDLGLKVKWATFNIGASSPEEYGNYFAWGDTLAIPESENEAYWSDKYSTGLSVYVNDDKLKSEFDVAKSWGKSWRLPTSEECKELLNECDWVQTELNNVSGYKITGPNGNHIFLPFAGMKIGLETMNCSEGGYYWSSNIKYTSPIALFFYHTNKGVAPMNNCGYAIRPVID